MKKILSLILVAIMLVTAMPVAFAEGNTYKVGDIIQFGSYPQSEVKDEALIANLNALAPKWDDWTSYGYYSGDGTIGSMVQGDWMRYTDITYNGNKYRGVKFTQYRPYYTIWGSSSNNTYQDDNGYSTNTVYWFKFEFIDWRVLDPATGLVMCETIIDSQSYSNTIYYDSGLVECFNDTSYNNYASDYETSSIRQWLNNDFYNTAFTDSEKGEINTTTLNNDGYLTSIGTPGYEEHDSNSTNDKIFLLSFNEVRNSNFGFSSDYSDSDKARQAQGSDYAKSQGLNVNRNSYNSTYDNNSNWLLRSPGYHFEDCCCVNSGGGGWSTALVCSCRDGIRPALRFNDISKISRHDCKYTSEIIKQPTHIAEGTEKFTCKCGMSYTKTLAKLEKHNYFPTVTPPTCTSQGYTTFTCECGDTYKDNYVYKLDHKDDNGDYKCDYNCGYEFEKPEPEEELNFFEKIIEWFKDLFDKLFGWMK